MKTQLSGFTFAVLMLFVSTAEARVVRFEIESREPFAEGHEFGDAGAYERIVGRAYGEVDVDNPANAQIVDLKFAPQNEGTVEYASDFFLLKPVEMERGNKRLLYDVNNRGNKLMLGAFNDAGGNDPHTLEDAGNRFLMQQGYSLLWCGWNGDVIPGGGRMQITLPIAMENGKPVQRKIHAEICVHTPAYHQPLYWGNSDPYPVLNPESAKLTVRPHRDAEAKDVPREEWDFGRWENEKLTSDPKFLYLKNGFQPGWIYDLVYETEGSRISGLGLAAIRDVVSFFRYRGFDVDRTVNPLHPHIEHAYGFGISQSSRVLNQMVHEGFNSDEERRMVFDGILSHVGGSGRGMFNVRFAQTTRHGSQHEDVLYPSERFPFTTVEQTDPATGDIGSLLDEAERLEQVPKIMFTNTSTEYWCRGASLLHTDVTGKVDVPLAANVRLYFIAGAQHGNSSSLEKPGFLQPGNVLDHRPILRAMLVHLDRWVSEDVEPPESRYPRLGDGTLVDLDTYRQAFPTSDLFRAPEVMYRPYRLNFGPRWETEGIADIVPPQVGRPFRTLVPAVDEDGNEIAGIRLPDVAVPWGTFTGWNRRVTSQIGRDVLGRWEGSTLPFPLTPEQREREHDTRFSILDRYPERPDYMAKVNNAVRALEAEGLILPMDAKSLRERAERRSFWDDAEK
ncbi:MAG: alpha/beta hydrolase domain-containing protein [Planctomycetaceae bacterium]